MTYCVGMLGFNNNSILSFFGQIVSCFYFTKFNLINLIRFHKLEAFPGFRDSGKQKKVT